jgi:hypothetical protein
VALVPSHRIQTNTKHHPKAAPHFDASGQARKPAPENGALVIRMVAGCARQKMTILKLGNSTYYITSEEGRRGLARLER